MRVVTQSSKRPAGLRWLGRAGLALTLSLVTACGTDPTSPSLDDSAPDASGGSPTDGPATMPDSSADAAFDEGLGDALPPGMACTSSPSPAFTHRCTIMVDDLERVFYVVVPPRNAPGEGWPTVFMLHGNDLNAASTEAMTGVGALGELEGFVSVFPEGLAYDPDSPRRLWYSMPAKRVPLANNVKFLDAVLVVLPSVTPINRKRIYASGFSAGAGTANGWAFHSGDKLAAIAPVAGTLSNTLAASNPVRAVPVFYFHGDADKLAYWEGGSASNGAATSLSALAYVDWWVAAHDKAGRKLMSSSNMLAAVAPDNGTSVSLQQWTLGGRVWVSFARINGGGHTWPGGKAWAPESFTGAGTNDIDATKQMWSFFLSHRL